ncbi:tetratricopeptide repeat protein [Mangrovivirga cuniculi]|nr:tetratricopeptide repeat protein [Mangrovivirga cuniculi]
MTPVTKATSKSDSVYNKLKINFKTRSHEIFINSCTTAINLDALSKPNEGKVRYMMAQSYNNKGDLINCVQNLFLASDIFVALNDKEKLALTYNFLGEVYRQGGEYIAAIDYFKESLSYFAIYDNYDNMAMVNYNLGLTYYDLEDYESAKTYFYDALENNQRVSNIDRSARIYNLLGAIHFQLQDYEVARSYYHLSMEIYANDEIPVERYGIAYSNLAEIHLSLGNFDKAISVAEKALSYKEKPNGNPESYDIPDALITLAKAYSQSGNIEKGMKLLENGILEKNPSGFHENYFNAISLYFALSENSSRSNTANSIKISNILVEQTKLLQQQNKVLNNAKSQYLIRLADSKYKYTTAVSGIQADKKINYWTYIIVLSLILIAVGVHFYRRKKRKEKLKKSLSDLLN